MCCGLASAFFEFATATDDDQAKSNERSGNASCCDTLCFRPLHCNAIMHTLDLLVTPVATQALPILPMV